MRVYRKKVFETNSSSCHTVNIEAGPAEGAIPKIDGTLELELGEFGWSGSCDTWREKLSYLVLLVWCFSPDSEIPEDASLWCGTTEGYEKAVEYLRSTDDFRRLEDIIKDATGATGIDLYGEGYIDHQSYEDYKSFDGWLADHGMDSDEAIRDFVFGDSWIHIDNDNH